MAENNPMLKSARSSLIVDNQVLRGRPLGRFHPLGEARAPSSAILVSAEGARPCDVAEEGQSMGLQGRAR